MAGRGQGGGGAGGRGGAGARARGRAPRTECHGTVRRPGAVKAALNAPNAGSAGDVRPAGAKLSPVPTTKVAPLSAAACAFKKL